MRYTGNVCDGCGQVFTDSDDVVVCPECGTAQHRHCYDEKGECVNACRHVENFQWKAAAGEKLTVDSSTLSAEKQTADDSLICPNCKTENPAGSVQCKTCGMKFTLFGMNVVEAMKNEEEKHGEASRPPFESREYSQNEYYGEDDDRNIFKGPYPDTDTTLGIRTNTMGIFMRGNADYYIRKFKMFEAAGKTGFNFAAFFFSPYWFFYRKLIRPGIIFLTIELIISIVLTPFITSFYEVVEQIAALGETVTEEAVMQLIEGISGDFIAIYIGGALLVVLKLFAGFLANKLYKNHVLSAMNENITLKNRSEKVAFFTKAGGVSMMFVLIAYAAQYLLSVVAGMIIG